MTSQNPYWGELPAPKVSRGNSVKQPQVQRQRGEPLHVDTQAKGDRLSAQSQSRPNRYSNLTDSQTTTHSPYASPTASDFHGDGLAPRPSSYQYKSSDPANNDEFYERRRRRQSRNREQYGDEASAAPLPAAPDVPRGPPLSYRPPNGSARQNGPPTRSSRQSDIAATNARLEGHDRSQRRESYPAGEGQSRRPSAGTEITRERLNGHSTRGPQRSDSTRTRQDDLSVAEAEAQKRREWAPDRSPLQRLEVTLDDITKEEKRARVQEAELLARESKAGRGGERANQGSVSILLYHKLRWKYSASLVCGRFK